MTDMFQQCTVCAHHVFHSEDCTEFSSDFWLSDMPVQIQSQRNKAAKPSITVQEDMGGGGHLCAAWKDIHQFSCPLSVSFTLFFDIDKRHRNRNSSSFRETRRDSGPVWCHCFAFFWMVPTAEMTVVLVPLAVVVTDTTEGRVAVVVMMVGWARVTGMAESHLLLRFWASAGDRRQGRSEQCQLTEETINPFMRVQRNPLACHLTSFVISVSLVQISKCIKKKRKWTLQPL